MVKSVSRAKTALYDVSERTTDTVGFDFILAACSRATDRDDQEE